MEKNTRTFWQELASIVETTPWWIWPILLFWIWRAVQEGDVDPSMAPGFHAP